MNLRLENGPIVIAPYLLSVACWDKMADINSPQAGKKLTAAPSRQ
jgi:hypothetical protein